MCSRLRFAAPRVCHTSIRVSSLQPKALTRQFRPKAALPSPRRTLELLDGISGEAPAYERVEKRPIKVGNALKLPIPDDRTSTDRNSYAGVATSMRNEDAEQVAPSIPKFRAISIPLDKIMGGAVATSELVDDMPNFAPALKKMFIVAAARSVDEGILFGRGVGGFLGVINSGALVSVTPESGQAAASVRTGNILSMWSRLHASGQRRAVWFYNQSLAEQLFNLKDGAGATASHLVTMGEDGPCLLGRPLIAHESCRTPGSVGDILLVDPQSYVCGYKPAGPQFDESIMVRFVEHQSTFRFIWRINGNPGIDAARSTPHQSATVSPFVALGAR